MSSHIDELKAAREHIDMGLDHHADGNYVAVKRRLELARGCVARAIENAIDPAANPSGAMGAQTSNGQQPRGFDPESVRQRDQHSAVEDAYRRRMALEGGRR